MKIRRYTVGGITYTPFVPGGQQSASSGSSGGSSSGSDKDAPEKITGTIKKEIVDILKSNGLPSDVDAFLGQANNYLMNSMSLSDMSLFGGTNDDYDLSELIRIQSLASKVTFNKEKHKEAIDALNDQDAWGEIATDSRGYIYVVNDEGQIDTISPTEFKAKKHTAITNEQLLGLREQNSQFALNSDILTGMTRVVGMKTIQDYLRKLSSELGTNELQGYASKNGAQISHGIQALMEAGPDGFYKVSDETQARDINVALEYLYQNLTPQMKRTLHATVAANGGDVNKDAFKFIGMILMNNIDTKRSVDHDANFDDLSSGAGSSSGSGSGSSKTEDKSYEEQLVTPTAFGTFNQTAIITTNGSVPMVAWNVNMGPILTKDESQPIGDVNVHIALMEGAGIGKVVDRSAITFGDIHLDWDDASKLMYDEQSNLHQVWLPATEDSNGRIRPNLELHQKVIELNDNLVNMGMTPGQIKSAIKGIKDVAYDEKNNVIYATNVQPFLTFSAIASDDALGKGLASSKYLHDMERSEDNAKKHKYNEVVGQEYSPGAKNDRIDAGASKSGRMPFRGKKWFGMNFYQGNVFIPYVSSHIGVGMGNKEQVAASTYLNIMAKAQEQQRVKTGAAVTDYLVQQGQGKFTR